MVGYNNYKGNYCLLNIIKKPTHCGAIIHACNVRFNELSFPLKKDNVSGCLKVDKTTYSPAYRTSLQAAKRIEQSSTAHRLSRSLPSRVVLPLPLSTASPQHSAPPSDVDDGGNDADSSELSSESEDDDPKPWRKTHRISSSLPVSPTLAQGRGVRPTTTRGRRNHRIILCRCLALLHLVTSALTSSRLTPPRGHLTRWSSLQPT